MVHPFYDRNISQPGERRRIRRSIERWQSFSEAPDRLHQALVGYSFTGAASLYSAIGDGDAAYSYLSAFLATRAGGRLRFPDTQYYEHDGNDATTVETPLTFASAVCDMLPKSWDGTIRVFPALPSHWKDVRFDNLLADGGVAVSAELSGGRLVWLGFASRWKRRLRIVSPVLGELAQAPLEFALEPQVPRWLIRDD